MTIGKKTSLERRKFLGTLGASAGVAAVAAGSLSAPMPAAAQKIDDKNAAPLKIIDFHNHYMGPSLTLTNLAAVPPAQKQYWEGVNRKLADPAALTASIESAGIAARVINSRPPSSRTRMARFRPMSSRASTITSRSWSVGIQAAFTAWPRSTPIAETPGHGS